MTLHPLLVGVFNRPGDAVGALRALRVSGLPPRKMGLALRSGEILQVLGLLSGADAPEHDIAGSLIGLGVPVALARQYWLAMEQGSAIVTAQPEDWQVHEATSAFESSQVSSFCLCRPGLPVACL